MKKPNNSGQTGIALIEALISFIVVAVGILGIAKLNSLLLQGTGGSKARAEAVEIAQDRIEKLRDFNLQNACLDGVLAAGTATENDVSGVNATYNVTTTLSDPTGGITGWKSVSVCVTWNNGTCDAPGDRIILNSMVGCEGTGTSAHIGPGNSGGMNGGFIKTPTGRGLFGGRDYGKAVGTDNKVSVNGTPTNDGTRTYTNPDDGALELVDLNGKVLLTVKKLACETSAPAFSTISGKVFVEAKNGNPIAAAKDLFVLSSDASYCAVLPYKNDWVLPSGQSGNGIKYFYTYYQCYVGAFWWGNIGVVRTDSANANERVCTGSTWSTSISTIFSKHPQQSTNRAYRGYRQTDTDIYQTKGIGEQDSTNTCTDYDYVPQHLLNHHFVHTVLAGQNTCTTIETDTTDLHNALGTQTGNPSVTTTASSNTVSANNNPGKYYCLSNNDGITCPDLVTDSTEPSTVLHGTITNYTGSSTGLTGIDANGSACTGTPTLTPNGTASYSYSCQIDWTGFTGTSWNGVIAFSASGNATLCPGSASPTVLPSGNSVAYTVNASNALNYPNSLLFTDIPNAVTDITLNFDLRSLACNTLGQPNVSWQNGNNPKSLKWDAITGATGYKISTCKQNTNTTCTPTYSITQTELTYSPNLDASVTNSQTVCIKVSATDSTASQADSLDSAVKCITKTKKNNSYEYSYSNG